MWSKSVAQSVTGGWSGHRVHSTIVIAYSGQFAAATRALSSSSGGNGAVVDLERVAEVVDVEQLRREGVAAVVPLALVGIDVTRIDSPPIGRTQPNRPTSDVDGAYVTSHPVYRM